MKNGNMYEFIGDKTWNPLAGECSHKCKYCYVNNWKKRSEKHRIKYSGSPRLDDNAMKKSLGKGKAWFVCSMNDLFAENVPSEIIQAVIGRANQFPENRYLFQTKNPERIREFKEQLERDNFTVCVTIESDIWHDEMGNAPKPYERFNALENLEAEDMEIMITVEPIMKFTDIHFGEMIKNVLFFSEQINIGADSKKNNLSEPSKKEIKGLLEVLSENNVHLKSNLKRLYP
jgi:DNA repair photolyase